MQTELLEYIYNRSQESCISNLKEPQVFEKYISILEDVKSEQFSLASWEYTYRYLCGFEKHFYCIDDVKRAIYEWAHEG